jgi:beta-glucanase (GH16 family)
MKHKSYFYTLVALAIAAVWAQCPCSAQLAPAFTGATTLKVNPLPMGPAGQWTVILDENFDEPSLNTKLWNDKLWFPGTVNKEIQFYHSENVAIKDGKLFLTARKETVDTGWDGSSPNLPTILKYTSGLIQSRDKFESGYGVYEARLKLPKGKGYFPAFWLKAHRMAGQAPPPPPEIDIMENLGHETTRTYHTYHYFDAAKKAMHSPGNAAGDVDYSANFHTFTVEWSPTTIRWFIDGVERRKAFSQPEHIWKDKMFIVLNVAVGSSWSGPPNANTQFPQSMEVDYVRVWKPAAK